MSLRVRKAVGTHAAEIKARAPSPTDLLVAANAGSSVRMTPLDRRRENEEAQARVAAVAAFVGVSSALGKKP